MVYQVPGARYWCIALQLRSTTDDLDEILLSWVSSLRENARSGHTVEHTLCRSSKSQSWYLILNKVLTFTTRLNSTYIGRVALYRYGILFLLLSSPSDNCSVSFDVNCS